MERLREASSAGNAGSGRGDQSGVGGAWLAGHGSPTPGPVRRAPTGWRGNTSHR